MNNKIKNQIESELRQVGFSDSDRGLFMKNMTYADKLLSENEVIVPEGLAGRVLDSVIQKQRQGYSLRRYYLRKIVSMAAMLLLVISLSIYYSGDGGPANTTIGISGVEPVTSVTSNNPFAHPSLIMDVLMERSSANSVDGYTLDAVSEFWGYPDAEIESPTSDLNGDSSGVLA